LATDFPTQGRLLPFTQRDILIGIILSDHACGEGISSAGDVLKNPGMSGAFMLGLLVPRVLLFSVLYLCSPLAAEESNCDVCQFLAERTAHCE